MQVQHIKWTQPKNSHLHTQLPLKQTKHNLLKIATVELQEQAYSQSYPF